MANIRIPIHSINIEERKKLVDDWNISDQDKKDVLSFVEDLALGKVNKGSKISESRQAKYLYILKIPLTFFNKPISKLNLKDVEAFEKALTSNKIKSAKGTAFTDSTKSDIRKALRIYLKWKLKEKAIPLTDWFDTKVPKKTPDYLSEQEVNKLYKNCKNASERFLIAVLFDSGARAEEFHNIRFEDIQLPKGEKNFVLLTLKEEYSKTKGRVINLFWEHSLEAVQEYLEERRKDAIKIDEPVFKNSYDNSRQILVRLGKKVLGKSIHYHLFRHSSATHYASQLNRQELCYRYGWKFSSGMPDDYISRAGMENKQLDEKFTATQLGELKSKLSKEELERKRLQEKIEEFMRDEEERAIRRDKALEFIEKLQNDPMNLKQEIDAQGNTIVVIKRANKKR